MSLAKPIGVFDSGYGGLTVLQSILKQLPQYDYLYLGDNARTPYGTRSFDLVYQYTLEGVKYLLKQNCPLIVLACNTASARALRKIQQEFLLPHFPEKRVLGIIRPTTEKIAQYSKTGSIGILATPGTVTSNSYRIEIEKFFPQLKLYQQACPMWVPLIENDEWKNEGGQYFIQRETQRLLIQNPDIDAILLGCTHYPIIAEVIKKFIPKNCRLIKQGPIVSSSLKDYLNRHPEIQKNLSQRGKCTFLTTGSVEKFNTHAPLFLKHPLKAIPIEL